MSANDSPEHPSPQVIQQLMTQGRWAEARQLLRSASRPNELGWRAVAEFNMGDWAAARASFLSAIAGAPENAILQANFAHALVQQGELEEAERHFEAALSLQPDLPHAVANYCEMLVSQPDGLARIEQVAGAALELNHLGIEANVALAKAYLYSLRQKQAIELMRELSRRHPEGRSLMEGYLLMACYSDAVDPAELAHDHRQFGALWLSEAGTVSPARLAPDHSPGQSLRVGILTTDAYLHPVGQLLASFLPYIDRDRADVTVYSCGDKRDDVTGIIENASRFVDVAGVGDAALVERIRNDHLHILVDAIGITRGHRLAVLARRCAPVQLGWAGYIRPSGLPVMDGYIGDAVTLTDANAPYIGDTPYALPDTVYCYAPVVAHPEVSPLPAASRGAVTFGSLNNLAKLNPSTLDLWAAVLRAVPDSRLLLNAPSIADTATRERLLGDFAQRQVAPERLTLGLPAPFTEYLESYKNIDILLDPFPYNGGVTSLHSLWQGVPVLTLPTLMPAGRVGASLMRSLDLPQFVAESQEDFVHRAAALAADIPALAVIRSDLRRRLGQSAAGNGERFANHMLEVWGRAWSDFKVSGGDS